ncbi:MAG: fasciclin domain-containing protein [Oceanicaulis sp.]
MRFATLFATTALAFAGAAAPALAFEADHHGQYGEQQTIVEIAAGNDNFSTLVAAVQAAGLAETLSGDGPFTVFAPVNDAFAALPDGTIDSLLMEENKDQLTSILTYHVVPGEYLAAETPAGTYELETVQGDTVNVVVGEDGSVTVDGANVVMADVDASNGVIHAIDAVIMPGM